MTIQAKAIIALITLLALVGSHFAVGWWQNGVGRKAEQVAWQKRDNTELVAANAKILELNTKARVTEQQIAKLLNDASAQYQKGKEDGKAQRAKDVASARDGTLRLQFVAAPESTGGSTSGSATSSPRRCDDAAPTELPREIVENLFEFANDADEVVFQLTACQAALRADRAR